MDEAGRGCLAGPVVAGSVIIPTAFFREPRNRLLTAEMNDSKQFDEAKREQLYDQVMVLAEEKRYLRVRERRALRKLRSIILWVPLVWR